MSLFNKQFGAARPTKVTNESRPDWNGLTEIKQLETLQNESFEKPILIFKHSTRCGVSRMVLKNFESDFDLNADEVNAYFLDLLSFREISDEIARRFGVAHQSPQLLLIKDGQCSYAVSHSDIDASTLKEKIRS